MNNKVITNLDSYGSFYSKNHQIINENCGFIIETNTLIKNLHHLPNSQNIKILKNGIYIINLVLYLEENTQVALFINGKIIESTIMSTSVNGGCVVIHEMLLLNEGNVL